MLDFERILNEFLQQNNISLLQLNARNKLKLKNEILREFIRRSVTGGISQREAHKKIRALGLKFTNEEARETYRQVSAIKPKTDYPSRLRKNFRPNLERIPIVEFKTPRDAIMYGAKVYLNCKNVKGTKKGKKKLSKSVPKTTIKISSIRKYNNVSEYGFWSNELLTRGQVEDILFDYFMGMNMKEIYGSDVFIGGTNYDDIKFNVCDVIAFKYIKAIRG
jgi:hypothetical protein